MFGLLRKKKQTQPAQDPNVNAAGDLTLPTASAKSGIKIKPENKGKFTATKKATGKSTEELTHSKNKKTKMRAVFARNARRWAKKKFGGILGLYKAK